MKAIDSHMHCGIQNVHLSYEMVRGYLDEGDIQGSCLFAPVEDVYDRDDEDFEDSTRWIDCRQRANEYLLDIQQSCEATFAYYFAWNDFRKGELQKGYRDVKWHRHTDEPLYHYSDPGCEAFLQEVYRLQLPVVLEESFENTLYFLKRVGSRTTVIIPHLGMLNGGFLALFRAGIWNDEKVFADTALASSQEILMFLEKYGSDRLLFGSDFPFGVPYHELLKISRLNLPADDFEKIAYRNIMALVKP